MFSTDALNYDEGIKTTQEKEMMEELLPLLC